MSDADRTHAYIVGAGFSHHAGLPLQSNFTEALLKSSLLEPRSGAGLIKHLRRFVHDAFDHNESARAKFWPNLEDVFTNIDLAANTGHHLGAAHAPSDLRTIRRVLLVRMMCMLDEQFSEAELGERPEWAKLTNFFKAIDVKRASFISINWDTVIERRLAELQNVRHFDYRCGAVEATFPRRGNIVRTQSRLPNAGLVPLVKIHGSVNWLYCDNCRQLYWFSADDAIPVAMQLLTPREGKDLAPTSVGDCAKWKCQNCTHVSLTTRIATFSFLKALDFPMFEKSWLSAEQILRQSTKWIFIGYSLPAADYEFKHLLKRVQLSRMKPPEFGDVLVRKLYFRCKG